jgi:hypothetical protein
VGRSSSVFPLVRVQQSSALIYGDRVMMELADVVAFHLVAKLVISPGNPNVSVKIFNNSLVPGERLQVSNPARLYRNTILTLLLLM